MSKYVGVLLVFVLAVSSAFEVLPVEAEGQMIVVPDTYQTITEAIANADNGDTIFVRKGTYEGPVNQTVIIDKTLSIVGENAEETTINLHPAYNVQWLIGYPLFSYTDAISIEANDVTLSNLTINISPGGNIRVSGDGVNIIGNKITKGGDTKEESNRNDAFYVVIDLLISGSKCNITDNFSRFTSVRLDSSDNFVNKNRLSCIRMNSSDRNTISLNNFELLELDSSFYNLIEKNNIDLNDEPFNSIYFYQSSHNFFQGNAINLGSQLNLDSKTENNTFYHNNFVSQDSHFSIDAVAHNVWDNGFEGNFWSSYNGSDFNGDGIGDSPYVIDANNVDRYPLMSPWTGSLPAPAFPSYLILPIAIVVVLAVAAVVFVIYIKKRRK